MSHVGYAPIGNKTYSILGFHYTIDCGYFATKKKKKKKKRNIADCDYKQ